MLQLQGATAAAGGQANQAPTPTIDLVDIHMKGLTI